MGGDTAFGWVYSSPTAFQQFNACNPSDPALGAESGGMPGAVELASGYGDTTAWQVSGTGSGGSDYIEYYAGQYCLTANGAGRELTVVACTPGNTAQERRIPGRRLNLPLGELLPSR